MLPQEDKEFKNSVTLTAAQARTDRVLVLTLGLEEVTADFIGQQWGMSVYLKEDFECAC